MDYGSKAGHVRVLVWWKLSGEELRWSSKAMDWASGREKQWGGFEMKWNTDAVDYSTHEGRVEVHGQGCRWTGRRGFQSDLVRLLITMDTTSKIDLAELAVDIASGKIPAIVDSLSTDGKGSSPFSSLLRSHYGLHEREVDTHLYFQIASLGPMNGQWNHFKGLSEPNPDSVQQRGPSHFWRDGTSSQRSSFQRPLLRTGAEICSLGRIPDFQEKYPAVAQWLKRGNGQKGALEDRQKTAEMPAAATREHLESLHALRS
ncbi:hypothetical protein BJ742DRAFT_770792 [Cladochytrium replicatum]|nr:hypothetical protein BJ742DRAFT_770792 [Cladochytrium replicatum]